MEKFYAHDAETGGTIARRHSLLTYYAGIYTYANAKFTLHREIDLKIKPNPGERYVYTDEAMNINKINLEKHDQVAITRDEAAMQLYHFMHEESDGGRTRLIRVGHNEPFDKDFVVNNLLVEEVFSKFTDYATLDTMSFARGLKVKGKLPKDLRLKLKILAEYLGVKVNPELLHTAKGDTHVAVACLEIMLTL